MNLKLEYIYCDPACHNDMKQETLIINDEDIISKFESGKINPMPFKRVPGPIRRVRVYGMDNTCIKAHLDEGILIHSKVYETPCVDLLEDQLESLVIETPNWSLSIQDEITLDEPVKNCVFAVQYHPQDDDTVPFAISHYDDGKEKYQSHEVSIFDGDMFEVPDLTCVCGWGEDYQEAFNNFLAVFNERMKELKLLQKLLNNNPDNVTVVETDCCGKPIE